MQRLTFDKLEKFAAQKGWHIERAGRKYEYWKVDENGVGPVNGTTYESTTLIEAYSEIYYL